MSGGHYDYESYHVDRFAESVNNDIVKECWNDLDLIRTEEVKQALIDSYSVLKRAAELAHAIEWLLSGDYGNETFLVEFNEIMKREYSIHPIEDDIF